MADHSDTTTTLGVNLSNRSYDLIRSAAQYWLPAIGTLYFALAAIWHFGYAEQVVGSIAALVTFLGVIMGLSKKAYDSSVQYDGAVVPSVAEDGSTVYKLQLDATSAEELLNKSQIVFKGLNNNA